MPEIFYETPETERGIDSIIARWYKIEDEKLTLMYYPDAPMWAKEDDTASYTEKEVVIPSSRIIRIEE
jgi:alanyl-tRNA synthetase